MGGYAYHFKIVAGAEAYIDKIPADCRIAPTEADRTRIWSETQAAENSAIISLHYAKIGIGIQAVRSGLRHVGIKHPICIMEMGSGGGENLAHIDKMLARTDGPFIYIAVDKWVTAVQAPPETTYQTQSDFDEVDIVPGPDIADVVFSLYSLDYADHKIIWPKVQKVLKPGGIFQMALIGPGSNYFKDAWKHVIRYQSLCESMAAGRGLGDTIRLMRDTYLRAMVTLPPPENIFQSADEIRQLAIQSGFQVHTATPNCDLDGGIVSYWVELQKPR